MQTHNNPVAFSEYSCD